MVHQRSSFCGCYSCSDLANYLVPAALCWQESFDKVQLFHCCTTVKLLGLGPGGPHTCGFLIKYTTCCQGRHLQVACSSRESKGPVHEVRDVKLKVCWLWGGGSTHSHCIPTVFSHVYSKTPCTPVAECGHLSDRTAQLCCICRPCGLYRKWTHVTAWQTSETRIFSQNLQIWPLSWHLRVLKSGAVNKELWAGGTNSGDACVWMHRRRC